MTEAAKPPFKSRLAAMLLWLALKFIGRTCSIRSFKGKERMEGLEKNDQPVLLCYWHNRIFFFAYFVEKALIRKGFKLTMMSSLSKDGEIGAILGKKCGALVVRGSSSRQGSKGLRSLYRATAKENSSIVILPDGSQGPVYEAKMGVVVLSQLTGCPILPMSYSVDRYWAIKSWDRMIIPKPFAKVSIEIGKPTAVQRDARDEEMESERVRIQNSLNELRDSTDAAAKVNP
ncbi:MAG: lysophospholipid acyltransferase family protein [Verrucomicrobiota bacterium]